MPSFSKTSAARLHTCHVDLQSVCNEAIKRIDFSVLEGHRGEEKQNEAFAKGFSKLRWPHGKHNGVPSRAVDLAPVPLDWNNVAAFHELARIVLEVAAELGIPLRWGGDWNRNGKTNDETFRDLPHFELVD